MTDLMDPAAEFLEQEGDELREMGIDDSGFTMVNHDPATTADFTAEQPNLMADVDFVNDFEGDLTTTAAVDPFEGAGRRLSEFFFLKEARPSATRIIEEGRRAMTPDFFFNFISGY